MLNCLVWKREVDDDQSYLDSMAALRKASVHQELGSMWRPWILFLFIRTTIWAWKKEVFLLPNRMQFSLDFWNHMFPLEKGHPSLMQKILMEEEKPCWIKFLKHTHWIPLILGFYILFNDILVLFYGIYAFVLNYKYIVLKKSINLKLEKTYVNK
jgi:hypothetical protein